MDSISVLYQKCAIAGIKDLEFKYADDGGIDLQVFGVMPAPCDRDSIPPLITRFEFFRNSTYKVFCGVSVCIPSGYVGIVVPRSSFRNKGLIAHSIWDAGYKGIMMPFVTTSSESFIVEYGERLLQLVIVSKPSIKLIETDFSSFETERGSAGVGSTGK